MNPAAEALFWPMERGEVPWPENGDHVLYVNAAAATALHGAAKGGEWLTLQTFRPWANALKASGLELLTEWPQSRSFTHVLLLGTKQAAETRALMGRAAGMLQSGGWMVCAALNDAGGKRLGADCTELGLKTETLSKHHCKIAFACKDQHFDAEKAAAWGETGQLALVPGTGFVSCPGLFSWNAVDRGSALLADALPPLKGTGADFGCGYGFLSRHIAKAGAVERLYCIDADSRAVEACRRNLAGAPVSCLWADLTTECPVSNLDWIVMNPPFHEGKSLAIETGTSFIATAARALKQNGTLYMVANSRLPYERALASYFSSVVRMKEAEGFKIYRAEKRQNDAA